MADHHRAISEFPNDSAPHWRFDPSVTYLNHGSYGACPGEVLKTQQIYRDRMEQDPMQFFTRDLEGLLDHARQELAQFVGANPNSLAFVPNTTTGVNAVLRSLRFDPGDELLTTTHAYNACRNAFEFVAQRNQARVIQAHIPFPLQKPEQVIETILDATTSRTRLALLDHVTSSTGLIFPIQPIIRELRDRDIDCLVDGAHAPGMIHVDLTALGAAYYVGNCHKWLCAPKGAAFLYVDPARQSLIHPATISHGANSRRTDRSRFHLEFDWTGTHDPSACLSVPEAIRFVGALLPGGWPEVRERNHGLALEARRMLCDRLEIPVPCPDEMVGALAAIPLPIGHEIQQRVQGFRDPLQDALYARFKIEVPVVRWHSPPKRLLRISAHLYNSLPQYTALSQALKELLAGC